MLALILDSMTQQFQIHVEHATARIGCGMCATSSAPLVAFQFKAVTAEQVLGDGGNSERLAAFSGVLRGLIEELEVAVSALVTGDEEDEYEEPSLEEASADDQTIERTYRDIKDMPPVNLYGQPACPVVPRLAPIPRKSAPADRFVPDLTTHGSLSQDRGAESLPYPNFPMRLLAVLNRLQLAVLNTPWLATLKQVLSQFSSALSHDTGLSPGTSLGNMDTSATSGVPYSAAYYSYVTLNMQGHAELQSFPVCDVSAAGTENGQSKPAGDSMHSDASSADTTAAVKESVQDVDDVWAVGNTVQQGIERTVGFEGLQNTASLPPLPDARNYGTQRLKQVSEISQALDDEYHKLFLQVG